MDIASTVGTILGLLAEWIIDLIDLGAGSLRVQFMVRQSHRASSAPGRARVDLDNSKLRHECHWQGLPCG